MGRTVGFGAAPNATGGSRYQRLVDLTQAMREDRVAVLFVHGANPAYASPAGLGLAAALARVPFKVSFSRFQDETAMQADVILPDHDPLEQWNDFEPRAGVSLLQQPVMQPVFDTRQTGDVLLELARLMGGRMAQRFTAATYQDYLQDAWRRLHQQRGSRETF
ncbi:MAG: hypothetical protein HYT81_03205, partial [Gemmatimonadetes bacterium]|nr:hypothetical protein [Gemmatimonadota bacterium]